MPLKVITSRGEKIPIHSPEDFKGVLGVEYLPHLSFIDSMTEIKVQSQCAKAEKKGWILPRQKWLGHFYAKGVRGGVALDLTIAWIDDKIGYGVWTNSAIPANAYVGEYTGILRKRRFFGRWQNSYCFDYYIGETRSRYVIDAEKAGNHTRFINHSATPNLETASLYCDGLFHVIVYANREIPAGTQLCYDYGENYWKKRGKPVLLTSR